MKYRFGISAETVTVDRRRGHDIVRAAGLEHVAAGRVPPRPQLRARISMTNPAMNDPSRTGDRTARPPHTTRPR
ncbi:hypothetical protein Sme01_57420 [Sphaerisporangium melleum]|uniref:Uncharacterized protein n=1 Tax=Sphaerisporangium melleum TaxID=321316 RepID=A0A917R8T9_9ACTN|nr:hypothetical protein GCM10007964_41300 [Sphaerisporangium melleum]GII73266.1 hypothetical protein Sme01_57420 [Sphaerisporangium melleum]